MPPVARIQETLSNVKERFNILVLLRHAERYEITNPTIGEHILLTPRGEQQAYQLGIALGVHTPIRIFHSPVPRCRQTAEHLFSGLKEQGAEAFIEGAREFLAMPYLLDLQHALRLARDFGPPLFIRKWFDGKLPDGIAEESRPAAAKLLRYLIASLQLTGQGMQIHVTHDWNILLLWECFLGLRCEVHEWPGYLDGMIVLLKGNSVTLIYQQHRRAFDLQSIAAA
jgi:broad specificity phosphatase PhoE